MKELTIKEKAKAYDNIIEKANKMNSENCEACKICIEELIPELRESEDESMVKFIKSQLFNIKKTITENYELDAKLTKAIAWLEKQGEKSILFTFDDVLALQCCMETVKKVQEDKELYNELLLLHNKVHDAYTITKR